MLMEGGVNGEHRFYTSLLPHANTRNDYVMRFFLLSDKMCVYISTSIDRHYKLQ